MALIDDEGAARGVEVDFVRAEQEQRVEFAGAGRADHARGVEAAGAGREAEIEAGDARRGAVQHVEPAPAVADHAAALRRGAAERQHGLPIGPRQRAHAHSTIIGRSARSMARSAPPRPEAISASAAGPSPRRSTG